MSRTVAPFRTILVPLDGSRLAEAALPTTLALATRLGARVTLLHVLEHGPPATVHGEPHLVNAETAQRYLHDAAERWATSGVAIDWHTHPNPERDVARSVAAHADELGADLIALAAHGSGGVRGFIFGRIAQQALRHGDRPVLLIEPTPAPTPRDVARIDLRVVLVPLDGTPDAELALPLAVALALALDARLRLVRVVPTRGRLRGDATASATMSPSATTALLDLEGEEAHAYLRRAVDALPAPLRATAEARRGDVLDELAGAARDAGAGIVVMSTHGKAGLESFLAGSVAATLPGRVTGAVLLIRRPWVPPPATTNP